MRKLWTTYTFCRHARSDGHKLREAALFVWISNQVALGAAPAAP